MRLIGMISSMAAAAAMPAAEAEEEAPKPCLQSQRVKDADKSLKAYTGRRAHAQAELDREESRLKGLETQARQEALAAGRPLATTHLDELRQETADLKRQVHDLDKLVAKAEVIREQAIEASPSEVQLRKLDRDIEKDLASIVAQAEGFAKALEKLDKDVKTAREALGKTAGLSELYLLGQRLQGDARSIQRKLQPTASGEIASWRTVI